jgi:hypothetical protein
VTVDNERSKAQSNQAKDVKRSLDRVGLIDEQYVPGAVMGITT